jgi:hypothetical protein
VPAAHLSKRVHFFNGVPFPGTCCRLVHHRFRVSATTNRAAHQVRDRGL